MIDNDLTNIINKIRDICKTSETYYTIWKLLLSTKPTRVVTSTEFKILQYTITYSSTYFNIHDHNNNSTYVFSTPQISPYNEYYRNKANTFYSCFSSTDINIYTNTKNEPSVLTDVRNIINTAEFESYVFQDIVHKESIDIVWYYVSCVLYYGFDNVYMSYTMDSLFFEKNRYDDSIFLLESIYNMIYSG